MTLTTMTSLRFLMFTFWNYYVLKLSCLESIMFSDATLSDINVVLCYVLSQYRTDTSHCGVYTVLYSPQKINRFAVAPTAHTFPPHSKVHQLITYSSI